MYLAQSTNWGHFPDRNGIWKCWRLRKGENRSTQRKTLEQGRELTTNSTHI